MDHGKRPMLHRNFYPGDAGLQLEEFLASYRSPPACPGKLVAAAAPHAGWRYSGGVAARALKTLAERSRPASIILLGAFHRPILDASPIYPGGAWETPFGPVAIDAELAAEALDRLSGLVEVNTAAHAGEHSLEVILPFVHELFPGVPVVPILVLPETSPARLGAELARIVEGREVVAVASTDLTHYGESYGFTPAGSGPEAHTWMRANDQRLLDLAAALKAEEIPREAETHRSACGPGALAAAVAFARERGAKAGAVLEHTDSHEVQESGEPFRMAVGYAGLVF